VTLSNTSFEEPGLTTGTADEWDEGYSAGAEDIALFAHYDLTWRPWEDFEQSWLDNHFYQLLFGISDLVGALFDAKQQEDFESGWKSPETPNVAPRNQASIFVFDPYSFPAALFDSGVEEFEDFEETWGSSPYNQMYEMEYDAGNFSAASFDSSSPENVEDFEEEWMNNEDFEIQFSYPGVSKTLAQFDSGAEQYEDFEEGWTTTLP
jgi:hypothetical protein